MDKELRNINDEIERYFKENSFEANPRYRNVVKRIENDLKEQAKKIFKNEKHEVFLFGSAASELGTIKNFDVDLTIRFKDGPPLDHSDRKRISRLQDLSRCLNGAFTERRVIKGQFAECLRIKHSETSMSVDITLNKTLEHFNSQLLKAYQRFSFRFSTLALIVKDWNKLTFKNNKASKKFDGKSLGMLNSYSITLMLIAFLQHKLVLPNLQKRNSFGETNLVSYSRQEHEDDRYIYTKNLEANVFIENDFERVRERFIDQDKEISAAELLIQFFEFYGKKFPCYKQIISISLHKPFIGWVHSEKEHRNNGRSYQNYREALPEKLKVMTGKIIDTMEETPFMIVDPFDWTYNPANTVKKGQEIQIRKDFRRAAKILRETHYLPYLIQDQ